jgi:hypothetical protein
MRRKAFMVWLALGALVLTLFGGCGSESKKEEIASMEAQAKEFMSDFPIFEDKEIESSYSSISYDYYPISEAEALKNIAFMINRGSEHYNDGPYNYLMSDVCRAEQCFSLDAEIEIDGDNSSAEFILYLDNGVVTFADFNDALYDLNQSDISGVIIKDRYYEQNMTDIFAEHYPKVKATGFNCDTDDYSFWECEKDGEYKYRWSAAYDSFANSSSIIQYKMKPHKDIKW